jgi:hypothetical protein
LLGDHRRRDAWDVFVRGISRPAGQAAEVAAYYVVAEALTNALLPATIPFEGF